MIIFSSPPYVPHLIGSRIFQDKANKTVLGSWQIESIQMVVFKQRCIKRKVSFLVTLPLNKVINMLAFIFKIFCLHFLLEFNNTKGEMK